MNGQPPSGPDAGIERVFTSRRRHLWTGYALMVALVLSVAVTIVLQQGSQLRKEADEQVRLLALVLEGHVSRIIAATANTMRALDDSGALETGLDGPEAAQRLLSQVLTGQPFMRSLSVLDAKGIVRASSERGDVGVQIDLGRFGRLPEPPDGERVGALLPVRSLSQLTQARAPGQVTALPMLRPLELPRGQGPGWLVALVNPDYFATQHTLILADPSARAVLTNTTGRVIASAGDGGPALGDTLPIGLETGGRGTASDHGSYEGPGSDGSEVIGAWRASPRWPLVMRVEKPASHVLKGWGERALPTVTLAMAVLALLTALFGLYDRGLRRDLAAMRHREAIHRELRASEERYRATFEQAAVGMLEQGRDRRFLRVNPALCQLLGYTEAELRALPASELIHPDDVAEGLRGFAELFAGTLGSFTQEKRYRHRDGHYVWVRLTASLARSTGDRFDRFERMIGIVEDISARRLAQAELEDARRHELHIGARIQQSLLVAPPDQRLAGAWLSTLSQASQGVDGDFFEIIPLGDRGIDVIVGDVMGKGVAAALIGAATKMQLSRSLADLMAQPGRDGELPSPSEIVAAMHRSMNGNLQSLEAFVTLSYVRLNLIGGTIVWVGCGHEEPVLVSADGTVRVLPNQHPPLGILDDGHFEQDELPWSLHDSLFMCSDGAADTQRADGSRVGREEVVALLSRLLREVRTPAAVLHALRRGLLAGGAQVTDDLTLVLAMAAEESPRTSRRELAATLDNLVHVRGLVDNRCRLAGLDERRAGLFTTACVEAFTNAVRHTRDRPDGAPVEVVVQLDDDAVVVDIVTLGEAFQPPTADADIALDGYPEGGFGLAIMRRACDRVEHLHAQGVNTVRLTLNRHPDGTGDAA